VRPNPIVWWELASFNAEKSVEFFAKVFNWDIMYDEKVGFYRVPVPEQGCDLSGGGVFTLRRARLPFLTLYIRVDDIDAKAKQVEESGGRIVQPPFSIPGGSRICLFNEPSGVTFAMIQSKRR
jgi:predicted enzyme related to lactoylglutathione lyase